VITLIMCVCEKECVYMHLITSEVNIQRDYLCFIWVAVELVSSSFYMMFDDELLFYERTLDP